MNPRPIFAGLIAMLLTTASLFSTETSQNNPAAGYPANNISVTKWDPLLSTRVTHSIILGTSQTQVLRLLGQPVRALNSDLAFYDNCQPDKTVPETNHTLVITYTAGKVSDLKFVNDEGAQQIANSASSTHKPTGVASADTTKDVRR